MTIGESIRHHRKRLHLTQAQLADRIGVSAQAVSKWENNVGLPDISMAVPLARALGTTTDELLRFDERYGEFESLWKKALRISELRQLEVAEAALKEFPYDKIYLFRAAFSANQVADETQDERVKRELYTRAAAYAKLSVEMDPEHPVGDYLLEELASKLRGMETEQLSY